MVAQAGGTLLIVDDEPSVRRSLERLLRKEGYDIRAAGDAESALGILERDNVDVILCDQDMPGKSGTQFLLEAAERYPHQRRIMISGRFKSEDVAVAMDSGAIHRFMMKPWDDAILMADVRAAFRQLMTDFALPRDPGQKLSWEEFDEKRRLSRELHEAASDGSLSLQYQPQIDLRKGEVCGFEALLRWRSSIGPVSPAVFVSIAEQTGSMSKLSHWVACEVAYRLADWSDIWSDAKIAFNVSPSDLQDDRLAAYLRHLLQEHRVAPDKIQVEVTESQALELDGDTAAMLREFEALGVSLAIDDFGAGATSLSYLAELPFSTIKLDKSMTTQLSSKEGVAVVSKVIEMAKCLGMKVTVEGIETAQQARLATELGADSAQGYLYSPPQTQARVTEWLSAGATGIPR